MTAWVIGSGNAHKVAEIGAIVGEFGVELRTPADVGLQLDPDEWADTFAANAVIKATAWAEATDGVAIADDSGLAVDALDGAPGVYSARYAGPDATDADNNAKLLDALAAVPTPRAAAYHCVIAVVWPSSLAPSDRRDVTSPTEFGPDDAAVLGAHYVRTFSGTMRGAIAEAPRGTGGFGYDPLFELSDGRRVAELDADEKNAISHRAAALRRLHQCLADSPHLR